MPVSTMISDALRSVFGLWFRSRRFSIQSQSSECRQPNERSSRRTGTGKRPVFTALMIPERLSPVSDLTSSMRTIRSHAGAFTAPSPRAAPQPASMSLKFTRSRLSIHALISEILQPNERSSSLTVAGNRPALAAFRIDERERPHSRETSLIRAIRSMGGSAGAVSGSESAIGLLLFPVALAIAGLKYCLSAAVSSGGSACSEAFGENPVELKIIAPLLHRSAPSFEQVRAGIGGGGGDNWVEGYWDEETKKYYSESFEGSRWSNNVNDDVERGTPDRFKESPRRQLKVVSDIVGAAAQRMPRRMAQQLPRL